MINWEPISEEALLDRMNQGYARMDVASRHLWNAIRIKPEKWRLSPHGDAGGGFWVVAIIGGTAIWYNDIEDGFNRSVYSRHGTIGDYWCNQDELDVTVKYLSNALDLGHDLTASSLFKKRA